MGESCSSGGAGRRVVHLAADAGHRERWADELELVDASEDVDLDLSSLDLVEPLLIVRLAAWLDLQRSHGRSVHVAPPLDLAVAELLEQNGVAGNGAAGNGDGWAAAPGESPPRDVGAAATTQTLIPLHRLPDGRSIDALVMQLGDRIEAVCGEQTKSVTSAMSLALQELCDNATTHGGNPHGAYVAALRCPLGRCLLAIGDLGIGMPSHIRRSHPAPMTDGQAISMAMRVGETGTHDPDRGQGYSAVIRTILRHRIPGAHLRVWSSSGRHLLAFRDGAMQAQHTEEDAPTTSGTWIHLAIRPA